VASEHFTQALFFIPEAAKKGASNIYIRVAILVCYATMFGCFVVFSMALPVYYPDCYTAPDSVAYKAGCSWNKGTYADEDKAKRFIYRTINDDAYKDDDNWRYFWNTTHNKTEPYDDWLGVDDLNNLESPRVKNEMNEIYHKAVASATSNSITMWMLAATIVSLVEYIKEKLADGGYCQDEEEGKDERRASIIRDVESIPDVKETAARFPIGTTIYWNEGSEDKKVPLGTPGLVIGHTEKGRVRCKFLNGTYPLKHTSISDKEPGDEERKHAAEERTAEKRTKRKEAAKGGKKDEASTQAEEKDEASNEAEDTPLETDMVFCSTQADEQLAAVEWLGCVTQEQTAEV